MNQALLGGRFVGLANYEDLLADPVFIGSLGITFGFTAAAVAAQMALGLAIALLLNVDLPYMRVFRTALIVPMMITPIVGALCWKLLLDPSHGRVQLLARPERSSGSACPAPRWRAVWLVNVWQNTPYVALILLAGLRSLPSEPLRGGLDRRRHPAADVPARHVAAAAALLARRPAAAHDLRVPRVRQHLRPDRRRTGKRDHGAVDVHLSRLLRPLRLQPGGRGLVGDAGDVDADVPVLHRGDPPQGRALDGRRRRFAPNPAAAGGAGLSGAGCPLDRLPVPVDLGARALAQDAAAGVRHTAAVPLVADLRELRRRVLPRGFPARLHQHHDRLVQRRAAFACASACRRPTRSRGSRSPAGPSCSSRCW